MPKEESTRVHQGSMGTEVTTTYRDDLTAAAKAAGQVANYCDHADHNEPVDSAWVLGAAESLRSIALRVAVREGVDIVEAYAARLEEIEGRNVRGPFEAFDGPGEARAARTWRQLQRVQTEHDRLFHPDVAGLHKSDQLQHYVLHLSKLVAALASQPSSGDPHVDFVTRRLPDMLLFGIALSTVMAQKLPETQIIPVQSAPPASMVA
jgi:hypothetical protein